MRKANSGKIFIVLIILLVPALIYLYAGSFLFVEPKSSPDVKISQSEPMKKTENPSVKYKHLSRTINGLKQEINILEIDLKDGRAEVKPALSFDKIFGFEKLSKIAERKGAYAAINSGFFYEYGRPSGMVVIDGELITSSTGKYPVFIISNKRAEMKEVRSKLWIEYGGNKLDIDNINAPGTPGETVLYTPAYGTKSRAKTANITATVVNSIITDVSKYPASAPIPQNGMLLTYYISQAQAKNGIPLKKGDRIKFDFECGYKHITQAYECGSWIVKDGEIVIGQKDEWVGVMTNRDPRTVIGLKDQYTVVLLTVDGRQPGYSAGLKGEELGQLLISLGIKNAAMLDGGASTEMIVKNKIVNRPSYKGLERPLAGALIVKYKE